MIMNKSVLRKNYGVGDLLISPNDQPEKVVLFTQLHTNLNHK